MTRPTPVPRRIALPLAVVTLLGACAAGGTHPRGEAGACRRDTLAALAGRRAPDDATLRRLTGAATIRRLPPGAMATRDFREDRLSVNLDDAGRILSAYCG